MNACEENGACKLLQRWPLAAVLQAASQGQPLSPGKLARLDQELCRLLGDTMRESRGKLR